MSFETFLWLVGGFFGLVGLGLVFAAVDYYLLRKKANYTVEGKPYLKVRAYPEVISKLDGILERKKNGSFPSGDRLIKGTLTRYGEVRGEFWFYPETLALMGPEELVAKLSGTDPSKVKTLTTDGKIVISGGEYALYFKGPVKVVVEERSCGSEFAAGYSLGSIGRS